MHFHVVGIYIYISALQKLQLVLLKGQRGSTSTKKSRFHKQMAVAKSGHAWLRVSDSTWNLLWAVESQFDSLVEVDRENQMHFTRTALERFGDDSLS